MRYAINIDHHPGNLLYGALNWMDLSAAACGEMVFDLVSSRCAAHLRSRCTCISRSHRHRVVPLLNITPDVDICRLYGGRRQPACGRPQHLRCEQPRPAETVWRGAQPDASRSHRPIATLSVDATTHDRGGTYEDTEGLINLPLTVKEILAVVFFKEIGPGDWRQHALEGQHRHQRDREGVWRRRP
jgi:phosphoesterase RecJ-like protein